MPTIRCRRFATTARGGGQFRRNQFGPRQVAWPLPGRHEAGRPDREEFADRYQRHEDEFAGCHVPLTPTSSRLWCQCALARRSLCPVGATLPLNDWYEGSLVKTARGRLRQTGDPRPKSAVNRIADLRADRLNPPSNAGPRNPNSAMGTEDCLCGRMTASAIHAAVDRLKPQ